MEGFLLKWTNYVYGWKRRYFVLDKGVLCYSKAKKSNKKGEILMSNSLVLKHPTNPKRFSIENDSLAFLLKAHSAHEAEE